MCGRPLSSFRRSIQRSSVASCFTASIKAALFLKRSATIARGDFGMTWLRPGRRRDVAASDFIPKQGHPRTEQRSLNAAWPGAAQAARERLGSTVGLGCQAQLKKLGLRPNFEANRLSIILP